MLADSENEKSKWVGVLSELHKILKKNKFRDRSVFVPKEAYDSTLPLIKTTQAAAIIGGSPQQCPWRATHLPCQQGWPPLGVPSVQPGVCHITGVQCVVSESGRVKLCVSVTKNKHTFQMCFLLKKQQYWSFTLSISVLCLCDWEQGADFLKHKYLCKM